MKSIKKRTNVSPYELGMNGETKMDFLSKAPLLKQGGILKKVMDRLNVEVGFVLNSPEKFSSLYEKVVPSEKEKFNSKDLVIGKKYDLFFNEMKFSNVKFIGIWNLLRTLNRPLNIGVFHLPNEEGVMFLSLNHEGIIKIISK